MKKYIVLGIILFGLVNNCYSQYLTGKYRSSEGDEISFKDDRFTIKLYRRALNTPKFGAGKVILACREKFILNVDGNYKIERSSYQIIQKSKCDSTIISVELIAEDHSNDCEGINWGIMNLNKHIYTTEFDSTCKFSENLSRFENQGNVLFISMLNYDDVYIDLDYGYYTKYLINFVKVKKALPKNNYIINFKRDKTIIVLRKSHKATDRNRIVFEKVY